MPTENNTGLIIRAQGTNRDLFILFCHGLHGLARIVISYSGQAEREARKTRKANNQEAKAGVTATREERKAPVGIKPSKGVRHLVCNEFKAFIIPGALFHACYLRGYLHPNAILVYDIR
jgi:hypothetical protein